MTAWLDFVKQYAKENNITYKQAMTDAKQHYTKKVKLNIIEDEPIRRPAIEPPPVQTRELTETKEYKLQFAKKRRKLTKKQQRKKPPSYPPTIIEEQPKKKKVILPSPYRKVKLNIVEDEDAPAVELPKIEPPPVQTRELTETIETTDEPIPQKVRKLRKRKLDIQESPLPPLVSQTEDELMKTSIPKLKEMLKELNWTKIAKFKKQDYIDKILELKNIPKGVWWRYKYPWLYKDLTSIHRYLNADEVYYNIEYQKKQLQHYTDKLKDLKKNRIPGEEGRTQISLTKRVIDSKKDHIKEYDRLKNIDFEQEVKKLEDEDAARKKRFEDMNKE